MVIPATAVERQLCCQPSILPCISVSRLSADTVCREVCAGWAALHVHTLQRALQQRCLTCCNTRPCLALIQHKVLASNPSDYTHLPSAASGAAGPHLRVLGINS